MASMRSLADVRRRVSYAAPLELDSPRGNGLKIFAAPPQAAPLLASTSRKSESDVHDDLIESDGDGPTTDSPHSRRSGLRRNRSSMLSPTSPEDKRSGGSEWTAWSLYESDATTSSETDDSDASSEGDANEVVQYGLLRATAHRVVTNPVFEWVVCTLILCNCVTLALEAPGTNSDVLNGLEFFFTVCFSLEVVLKVFAKGVYFAPNAYFKSKSNWFDFTIVAVNFVGLFVIDANVSSARAIRVLKVVLMLDKFPKLKRVVLATLSSLHTLFHVWLILVFLVIVHGIWALQLWRGTFTYRCVLPETGETNGQFCRQNVSLESNILSAGEVCHDPRFECVEFINPYWGYASFDDFPSAFLIIIQCVTVNSWSTWMYATYATNGVFPLFFFVVFVTYTGYLVLPYCVVIMKDSIGGSKRQRSARNRVVESLRKWLRLYADLQESGKVRWYEAAFMNMDMLRERNAEHELKSASPSSRGPQGPANRLSPAAVEGERHNTSSLARGLTLSALLGGSARGRWSPTSLTSPRANALRSAAAAGTADATPNTNTATDGGGSHAAVPGNLSGGGPLDLEYSGIASGGSASGGPGAGSIDPPRSRRPSTTPILDSTPPTKAMLHQVILNVNRCIPFIVVVHVIVLSLRHQGQPSELGTTVELVNVVCVGCYTVEMLLKLCAYRRAFFQDAYNVVDVLTVLWALEETIFKLVTLEPTAAGIIVIRCVRIIRVYKVFMGSSYMICQAEAVVGVARRVSFIVVLALYWLTATLVLMQTCGQYMVPPVEHAFKDFPNSALSTLQIITGDNWAGLMYSAMEGTQLWATCILFLTVHILGHIIFVHLFLAVVVEHFELVHDATAICREGRNKNKSAQKRQQRKLDEAAAYYKAPPSSPRRGGGGGGGGGGTAHRDTSFVTHQRLAVPEEYRHTPALCEAYMKGVTGDVLADDLIDYEMKNHKRGKKLCNAFARGHEARMESGAENVSCILGWSASLCALAATRHQEALTDRERAFWIFPRSMRLRALYIVNREWFERFFTFLAVVAAVLAFMEDIEADGILQRLDYALNALFFVEAMLKSVAHCFLFAPEAYLKNNWNVLEFSILVLMCVSYFTDGSKVGVLRIFRSLRSFRALRMIRRFESLRRVVVGLLRCLPGLVTISTLTFLLFLGYAVAGVELFGGTMRRCSVPYLTKEADCVGFWQVHTEGGPFSRVYPYIPPSQLVLPWNTTLVEVNGEYTDEWTDYYLNRTVIVEAQWVNAVQHFDHVPAALRYLFQIATLDRWRDTMDQAAENCRGDAYVSIEPAIGGCKWYGQTWVYFLSFIFITNLFVLPVVTAEVVVTFMRVIKELAHISDYSSRELSYFYMMKLLLFVHPTNNGVPRTTRMAKLCYRLSSHPHFDAFISIMIFLNILAMALEYHGMSDNYHLGLLISDYVFTFVFFLEALIKITALGWNYFKVGWNQFDCLLVASSILEIVVTLVIGFATPIKPFLLRSVRAFLRLRRAQRLLRLVRRARGVRMIFETVWVSLGMLLANVFLYLCLTGMFALLGIGLFGSVRKIRGLSKTANFDNFPLAALTLHRVATGDGWSEIMENCMITEPFCREAEGDCGWPVIAPVYFIGFKAVSYLILMALFIATVSDTHTAMKRLVSLEEGMKEIQMFIDAWSRMFSNEEVIQTKQLQLLMAEIGRTAPSRHFPPEFSVPFNFRRVDVLSTLSKFYIIDGMGVVHFSNVLLEIAFVKVRDALRGGHAVTRKEWWSFESDWYAMVPELRLPVTRRLGYRYTARDYFAALYIQTWYRFLYKLSKMRRLLSIDVQLYQVHLARRDCGEATPRASFAIAAATQEDSPVVDAGGGGLDAAKAKLNRERAQLLHSKSGGKPMSRDAATSTDDLDGNYSPLLPVAPGGGGSQVLFRGDSQTLTGGGGSGKSGISRQRLRAQTIQSGSAASVVTPMLTPLLGSLNLGGSGAAGGGGGGSQKSPHPLFASTSSSQVVYQPPLLVSPTATPASLASGSMRERGATVVHTASSSCADMRPLALRQRVQLPHPLMLDPVERVGSNGRTPIAAFPHTNSSSAVLAGAGLGPPAAAAAAAAMASPIGSGDGSGGATPPAATLRAGGRRRSQTLAHNATRNPAAMSAGNHVTTAAAAAGDRGAVGANANVTSLQSSVQTSLMSPVGASVGGGAAGGVSPGTRALGAPFVGANPLSPVSGIMRIPSAAPSGVKTFGNLNSGVLSTSGSTPTATALSTGASPSLLNPASSSTPGAGGNGWPDTAAGVPDALLPDNARSLVAPGAANAWDVRSVESPTSPPLSIGMHDSVGVPGLGGGNGRSMTPTHHGGGGGGNGSRTVAGHGLHAGANAAAVPLAGSPRSIGDSGPQGSGGSGATPLPGGLAASAIGMKRLRGGHRPAMVTPLALDPTAMSPAAPAAPTPSQPPAANPLLMGAGGDTPGIPLLDSFSNKSLGGILGGGGGGGGANGQPATSTLISPANLPPISAASFRGGLLSSGRAPGGGVNGGTRSIGRRRSVSPPVGVGGGNGSGTSPKTPGSQLLQSYSAAGKKAGGGGVAKARPLIRNGSGSSTHTLGVASLRGGDPLSRAPATPMAKAL